MRGGLLVSVMSCLLLLSTSFGRQQSIQRHIFLRKLIASSVVSYTATVCPINYHANTGVFHIPVANARNLPESTGASGLQRGTVAALTPVIKMRSNIQDALTAVPNIMSCQLSLSKIPSSEKEFKRAFDEYSEGLSYKQIYKDQNAFVVYYSGGFDGPNRPSIEAEVNKHTYSYIPFLACIYCMC